MSSKDLRIPRRPVAASTPQAESSQPAPPPRRLPAAPTRAPLVHNNSSIRIRRLPSSRPTESDASDAGSIGGRSDVSDTVVANRRRSLSAPQPVSHLAVPGAELDHHPSNEPYHPAMPAIQERTTSSGRPPTVSQDFTEGPHPTGRRPRGHSDLPVANSEAAATIAAGNTARAHRGLSRMRGNSVRSRPATASSEDEYDNRVLGLLDLVGKAVLRSASGRKP